MLCGWKKIDETAISSQLEAYGGCNDLHFHHSMIQSINVVQTTFYGDSVVGFSVVERLNDSYGVIVQRLINPDLSGIIEPNILLHYQDCLVHEGLELNIGGDVGLKGMRLAKRKLNPSRFIQIRRMKPFVRLTKEQWGLLKNGG
jgi:hypothetical protein